MRTMKDSGIEWIGEIPQEWETRQIKYVLESHSGGTWGTNKGEAEQDCICVRVADFDYSHLCVKYSDSMTIRSYPQKIVYDSVLKNGDILLEKSGGGETTPVGRSVLFSSEREMMCANFIEWLRPNSTVQSQFLNYWFSAAYTNGYSKRNVKQTTGIQNLDIPAFLSEKILVPTVEEQWLITKYLDSKCAEIDALIAAKEKTNALLKERRQSIIYEAVTKGLDPTVPMKNSGVEWIGEIPEGWELRKIKYNFDVFAGATPKSGETSFWDGDIPWITPADYMTEDVFVSAGRKSITQEGMDSCATTMIPEGSVVFSKRAPVGLVAISSNRLCTNQGCLSCVPKENVDAKYFYYTISVFSEQFDLLASGTTFKEISADSFANFKLPYPAYETQREIAVHLDNKCSKLDSAVEQNNATIQKLKEYRQSLIYEAVTGKIEV